MYLNGIICLVLLSVGTNGSLQHTMKGNVWCFPVVPGTYVVDDFREVSQLMLKTHDFPGRGGPGSEMGESSRGDTRGRVEYLPVHWHSRLHTTGVDE